MSFPARISPRGLGTPACGAYSLGAAHSTNLGVKGSSIRAADNAACDSMGGFRMRCNILGLLSTPE